MAMQVRTTVIGVDVSKAELVCSHDGAEPETIENTPQAIRGWLRGWAGPVCLAIEATGTYHLELALRAHKRGHRVYVISGYRLNRYRESIGSRAKTDAGDARLLARYLSHEVDQLQRWTPPPAGYFTLQRLLRRRARVVKARVSLSQSLRGVPELKAMRATLERTLERAVRLIDKRLERALQDSGWSEQAKRCRAIEGIGPITSTALALVFHRGPFATSDAFIAFIGLDVRVRESGRFRGRRRLTKQGDSEVRRLLYVAAMQAKRQPAWAGYYQRFIDRGLTPIQALNVLARKLARVAFSLMQNQTDYVPRIPCMET